MILRAVFCFHASSWFDLTRYTQSGLVLDVRGWLVCMVVCDKKEWGRGGTDVGFIISCIKFFFIPFLCFAIWFFHFFGRGFWNGLSIFGSGAMAHVHIFAPYPTYLGRYLHDLASLVAWNSYLGLWTVFYFSFIASIE